MTQHKETIYIGADHRGFEVKKEIIEMLREMEESVIDCGNTVQDLDDDYPDFAEVVAQNVSQNSGKGILICGSGIGMSIAANKVPGAYASLVTSPESAEKTIVHNEGGNILCLGVDTTPKETIKEIVKRWSQAKKTDQTPQRYKRRQEKIKMIEKKFCEQ
ncbi:MAG: RpiB/LacA/LacB family sugar-phosphate isomerase [Candidatus Moranbacteria bacterium]|nr:RpiB/LacA/LacB family sugar-phosphate isomerase [Candidatus Moranbacteria bacterium]